MAHIAVAITIYIVHDEGQWTSPVEVKIVPPQPYVSEAPMYAGVIVVADNIYDNDNNSCNTNSTNDINNTNNDTDNTDKTWLWARQLGRPRPSFPVLNWEMVLGRGTTDDFLSGPCYINDTACANNTNKNDTNDKNTNSANDANDNDHNNYDNNDDNSDGNNDNNDS